MNKPKTLEVKVERTIPASVQQVFDAWLDPKVPGTPWHEAEKLLLNPQVDGFFYWLIHGIPHYGRFTQVDRPGRLQHTWVSPNTLGHETRVSISFKQHGEGTLMSLVHSDLPDNEAGRSHEKGWNYFVGGFADKYLKT